MVNSKYCTNFADIYRLFVSDLFRSLTGIDMNEDDDDDDDDDDDEMEKSDQPVVKKMRKGNNDGDLAGKKSKRKGKVLIEVKPGLTCSCLLCLSLNTSLIFLVVVVIG